MTAICVSCGKPAVGNCEKSEFSELVRELQDFVAAAPHDYPGHNVSLFERAIAALRSLSEQNSAALTKMAQESDAEFARLTGLVFDAEKRANEQTELAAKSIRRLAELAEPGAIGAFASRDHWKDKYLAVETRLGQIKEAAHKGSMTPAERLQDIRVILASVSEAVEGK